MKIGRLERKLKVEREMDGQTDGRAGRWTKSIKFRSPMSYLLNKKSILKIGRLERKFKVERGTDGQTVGQTDGQKV